MKFQWKYTEKPGFFEALPMDSSTAADFLPYNFEQPIEGKVMKAVVVDVETTGLDLEQHPVTQIAFRSFKYSHQGGQVLALENIGSHYSDVDGEIPPHITELTGITKELIRGKKVPPAFFAPILEANVIIAHRAEFDRPRVERLMKSVGVTPPDTPWACSKFDIDWKGHGLPHDGLEMLSLLHGFFYDAHDAIRDVDAVAVLLGQINAQTGKTYLSEMLANARKKRTEIVCKGEFNIREKMKDLGYRFDYADKTNRKMVLTDEVDEEKIKAKMAGATIVDVKEIDVRTRFREQA